MAKNLTPRQIELARHALGLKDGRTASYRNYFVAGPGHLDYREWRKMCAGGLARRCVGSVHDHFWLTRRGAEAVLLPGETLDPEDFPPFALPKAATDE